MSLARLEVQSGALRDKNLRFVMLQVLKSKLDSMTQERDKAVEEVAKLDEALEAMQNGPNAELMQAWDTERRELLQDLEAAENRVLGMQTQVCQSCMLISMMPSAAVNNKLDQLQH